jgi:hypothetical protein
MRQAIRLTCAQWSGVNGIEQAREFKISLCNPACVVGREVYGNAVIDVEPLWVVIHLLNQDRGGCHESKRMCEIGKLEFAMQLVVSNFPSGKLL